LRSGDAASSIVVSDGVSCTRRISAADAPNCSGQLQLERQPGRHDHPVRQIVTIQDRRVVVYPDGQTGPVGTVSGPVVINPGTAQVVISTAQVPAPVVVIRARSRLPRMRPGPVGPRSSSIRTPRAVCGRSS
jgi:hypothetical protein